MQDWQRQSYLARQRLLKSHVFVDTKQQQRYQAKFDIHPAYLSKNPQVEVKDSNVVQTILTRRQAQELDIFLSDNELEGDFKKVFYSSLQLNGMQVRTEKSEVGIKTRDSIVCGRNIMEDEKESWVEYFFGTVRCILQYGDEDPNTGRIVQYGDEEPITLAYVAWFKVVSNVLGDDQLGGLAPIPVKKRSRQERSNGWINVAHLELAQHMVVGDMSDRVFYIIHKI